MRLSESAVEALQNVAQQADRMRHARACVQRDVNRARDAGASWASIGAMLGTTGEAARKTYGPKLPTRFSEAVALW